MLNQLLSILVGWITSVWTLGRLVFSGLNGDSLTASLQLLGILFLIGVADNLPKFFGRVREKVKRSPKEDLNVELLLKYIQAQNELERKTQ